MKVVHAEQMNPGLFAIRNGLSRGWMEFRLNLTNPQDLGFYLVMGLVVLGSLFPRRDELYEGTSLSLATLAMPGVVGGLVAFLSMIGAAYSLAVEREDGTLLRAKALPNGMAGYLTGQVLRASLETVLGLAIVIVPGLLLFDGLMTGGLRGWLTLLWVLALGLLATLPLGVIVGSLVKGPRAVSTWGMVPIMGLVWISGIFYPISALAGWLQGIAQVFPMYWLGLGMRSAFLPDAAAAVELTGSWRQAETVAVLGAWAVVGLLVAPVVLRRMARRESGANMDARRQKALQRIA